MHPSTCAAAVHCPVRGGATCRCLPGAGYSGSATTTLPETHGVPATRFLLAARTFHASASAAGPPANTHTDDATPPPPLTRCSRPGPARLTPPPCRGLICHRPAAWESPAYIPCAGHMITHVFINACTPAVCSISRNPSQRSLHNAPIFRLLLKVAVNGTHQCDFFNF